MRSKQDNRVGAYVFVGGHVRIQRVESGVRLIECPRHGWYSVQCPKCRDEQSATNLGDYIRSAS